MFYQDIHIQAREFIEQEEQEMTSNNNSAKITAEQLLDLLNRPDFVYTREIIEILERLLNDFDQRRDLHQEAVVEAQRKPLRKVFQLDYFNDDPNSTCSDWRRELRNKCGIVRVEISSDVMKEDAILGLKRIMKVLERHDGLRPSTCGPKEINTDRGPVIALPEPDRLLEMDEQIPF